MIKEIVGTSAICAFAVMCYASDKFIYDRDSGDVITATPIETIGQGDKILGARVWQVLNGYSPSLGVSDNLYKQVVTTNEEGVVTTNTVMKKNIEEMTYTRLWPLTEDERQAAKDPGLKTLENQFVMFYRGLGFETKPGFEEISALLSQMPDELEAAKLGLLGLSIDSAAKRYNMLWWDDCVWHPEIVTKAMGQNANPKIMKSVKPRQE